MPVDPNEMRLINDARSGDDKSFELLIEGCKTKAYNTALHYLKNEEDARDALQESLIKIFLHLDKFKGKSRFDTWVYRIVVNTCNDYLRKKSRSEVNSLHQYTDDGGFVIEIPDDDADPSEVLEKRETTNLILNCLGRMPKNQRLIIILRDIQGFTYEEIGEILGCAMGTVKSRINRARRRLKEYVAEQKDSLFV